MPQQWWLTLEDLSSNGALASAAQYNGLINRLWPQPADEHEMAKPWVLHGWPQRVGGSLTWSVTWLPDSPPPLDLHAEVGREWVLGRPGSRSSRRLGVAAAHSMPVRRWEHLLVAAPVQTVTLSTRSPVLNASRSPATGRRVWQPYPDPERFFGTVPRPDRPRPVGASVGRMQGVFSVVATYAPHVSDEFVELARRAVPLLGLAPSDREIRVVSAAGHDPSAVGWVGSVTLRASGAEAGKALAILSRIAEITGIGRGTAYGYGCVEMVDSTELPRGREDVVTPQGVRSNTGTASTFAADRPMPITHVSGVGSDALVTTHDAPFIADDEDEALRALFYED